MKPVVLLLTVACLAGCASKPSNGAVEALYRQGNAFYARGRYAEAGRTYERIIHGGFHNGYVYYNLGNAYFKQHKLGLAILSYERARRLIPRDPDVRANLEIARLRTVDAVQVPDPWIGVALVRQGYRAVTVNEATLAVSIVAGLLAALIIAAMLVDAPGVRRRILRGILVLGILLPAAGALAGFKIYDRLVRNEAIVLTPEFDVRSGPGTNYDQVFVLHEGVKVTVVERRGTWMRIALPDGKAGWIAQKAVAVI